MIKSGTLIGLSLHLNLSHSFFTKIFLVLKFERNAVD